tara:strand:+ start:998 stop:1465 length:468 start_codon:yes stop_codon:yes gene_type:complete
MNNKIVKKTLSILVDADACPVKNEITRVSERYNLEVIFVSNGGIRPFSSSLVKIIIVDEEPDAADTWIVNNLVSGDIIITNDIPLASDCLKLGAKVIKTNGQTLDQDTIGLAVASRNLAQNLRETGEIKGYQAPYSPSDRSQFLRTLDLSIQKSI